MPHENMVSDASSGHRKGTRIMTTTLLRQFGVNYRTHDMQAIRIRLQALLFAVKHSRFIYRNELRRLRSGLPF
jgi:hypothetical protein